MKTYKTKKDKHDFRPFDLSIKPIRNNTENLYEWCVEFDESCKYNLNNKDQDSWNKGGGIGNYFSFNSKNSVRWVWRYSLTEKKIEIGFYFKDDEGDTDYFSSTFIEFNKPYIITITLENKIDNILAAVYEKIVGPSAEPGVKGSTYTLRNISYHDLSFEYNTKVGMKYFFESKYFRRLGLYFGGQSPAPYVMRVKVDFDIFDKTLTGYEYYL